LLGAASNTKATKEKRRHKGADRAGRDDERKGRVKTDDEPEEDRLIANVYGVKWRLVEGGRTDEERCYVRDQRAWVCSGVVWCGFKPL